MSVCISLNLMYLRHSEVITTLTFDTLTAFIY